MVSALEAVRMLQDIDQKLKGVYGTLQTIAAQHPDHVTAALVGSFADTQAMIGAARLDLQKAAGLQPTDQQL
jgi:hypothetical protein